MWLSGPFFCLYFTKRRYNFHPSSAPSSSPALVEMKLASRIEGDWLAAGRSC